MKRREFLAGTASAAALLAGCSGGSPETESGDTGTSELLEPDERDYRSIDHGEELPQGIESRADVVEEKTDRLVFNNYNSKFEREESYVDVTKEGTQEVVREADGEKVDQDLYGLVVDVDASRYPDQELSKSFITDVLEDVAPFIHQGFYDSGDEIPDENAISKLAIEVEGDSSYGRVSYGMPSQTLGGDSIEEFGDTVLTYLEEGEESTAIEESVEENFQYAVE